MNIGRNIIKYRNEKKLSLKQLAGKMRLSVQELRDYESGKMLPSLVALVLLADILEVKKAALLGELESTEDQTGPIYCKDCLNAQLMPVGDNWYICNRHMSMIALDLEKDFCSRAIRKSETR